MTEKFKAAWYTPSVASGRTLRSVMAIVEKTLEEGKTKLEITIMPSKEINRIAKLELALQTIIKHYGHPAHDHNWAHYATEVAKNALADA